MPRMKPMMDPENMPTDDMASVDKSGAGAIPKVGPTLTLDKSQAENAKVGDQLRITGVGTVTGSGDTVTIQLTQVTAESDDAGQMQEGFNAGSKMNKGK